MRSRENLIIRMEKNPSQQLYSHARHAEAAILSQKSKAEDQEDVKFSGETK